MSTFVVDWLGRGGIAQTSAAWAIELTQRGHDVAIATRERRELVDAGIDAGCAVVTAGGRSSVAAHRAVALNAARAIRDRRPSCVVIQNYVIPAAELPVYRAARDVGARIVFVVHDDRLHSRVAGSHVGLRALMRRSDDLVAHSHWVARGAGSRAGRSVRVIALPVQLGMLRDTEPSTLTPPRSRVTTAVNSSRFTSVCCGGATRALTSWRSSPEASTVGRSGHSAWVRPSGVPA